jgi:hypothetical protein
MPNPDPRIHELLEMLAQRRVMICTAPPYPVLKTRLTSVWIDSVRGQECADYVPLKVGFECSRGWLPCLNTNGLMPQGSSMFGILQHIIFSASIARITGANPRGGEARLRRQCRSCLVSLAMGKLSPRNLLEVWDLVPKKRSNHRKVCDTMSSQV